MLKMGCRQPGLLTLKITYMKANKIEWWVRLVISVLSAIAGALGASAAI